MYVIDDSDVNLPAVDPRTISPAGSNELSPQADSFEELSQEAIQTEGNNNITLSQFDSDSSTNTNAQKKIIIKARRNIKPKVKPKD